MTEASQPPEPTPPTSRRRLLPVTITPGMPVTLMEAGIPATVVGITQAFCVFRIDETGRLAIARWREVAIGNLCPADPLLPADVSENDRRNAQATVLCELLALEEFGLSAAQAAALAELVAELTVSSQAANERRYVSTSSVRPQAA